MNRSGVARSVSAACFSSRSNRWLSTALPTRHSRHLPPPACLDSAQLTEGTEEILASKPGDLFQFKVAKEDDSLHAWETSDYTVQKVEWLIRGYSATVKGTMMNVLHETSGPKVGDSETATTEIQRLIKRLEEEGDLYMNLRHKTRSNLLLGLDKKSPDDLNTQDQDGDSHQDRDDSENNNEEFNVGHSFAAPGPTISMFDTFFDTLAISPGGDSPRTAGETLMKDVLERFRQDGGLATNTNPFTVPTLVTFNGVLRVIANTENTSERIRDECLRNALVTFDAFRDVPLHRSAATYRYMIQIFGKVIPPSEALGNIAHSMWHLAKEDQVIDDGIIGAMRQIQAESSEKFNKFLKEELSGKRAVDLPHQWRKHAKSRLFVPDDPTY